MKPWSGMATFDYEQLDPGIRRLVRWLHSMGLQTIDSGDGVTKFARREELRKRLLQGEDVREQFEEAVSLCGCAMEAPNVTITCPKSRLANVADELLERLTHFGIFVKPCNEDGDPQMQATYDPAIGGGPATVMLMHVSDKDLPEFLGNP